MPTHIRASRVMRLLERRSELGEQFGCRRRERSFALVTSDTTSVIGTSWVGYIRSGNMIAGKTFSCERGLGHRCPELVNWLAPLVLGMGRETTSGARSRRWPAGSNHPPDANRHALIRPRVRHPKSPKCAAPWAYRLSTRTCYRRPAASVEQRARLQAEHRASKPAEDLAHRHGRRTKQAPRTGKGSVVPERLLA